MESNEAQQQLREAERLGVATQVEASRVPMWATPLMTLALVGFFVLLSKLDDGAKFVASGCWTLFVLGWVYAIRRGNRAMPRRRTVTDAQRRHGVVEWLVLFVVANVLTFALSRVSWALVGVALGSLGTVYGTVLSWRARHS